jgi:autotransporter-associated beta strand protein
VNGIGGSASLTTTSGITVASGTNSYTGGTFVNGGTLSLSGANELGATSGTTTVSGGTLDLGGTTQTQSALMLGGGTVQNGNINAPITSTGGTLNGIGGSASLTTTSGKTIVSGSNTYTGATTVNGGVLDVVGTISDPTVNAGGTLMGTGTVAATQINAGGIFAPGDGTAGTSLTIAGNLAFASGAIYLLQVNPSAASFATVNGTAALGGATVNAVFANGSYVSKTYTIFTASGGVSGTFAPSAVNTNLPANFHTTLSYDANDAYLNLALNFAIPGGLNRNQQAVGNALTNFFNANGTIPMVYGALSPAGLTQASGELGTSSQQTTFNAMGQFMGLLTDPYMQRNGGAGLTPGASGFAEEGDASVYAARKSTDAFAMFTKAPPAYEQRWSVWASGFGGSQSTDGSAALGSNNTTSNIAATAVGADYLISPSTIAGFALAGGGTSFSAATGGTGRSDLFQAGAYLRHTNGPTYISAALAYGWQDITTNRTLTVAGFDQLRAEFNANAWSGRLEGGYRFVSPATLGVGITPYAAAQFVTFDLPAYAEQAISGSNNFALAYNAKDATDVRTELGIRTDKSFVILDGILTLRGRFAWAHDYDPDRSVAATFQTLPVASFVVNGAAQAADSALTTASAELRWGNGWSVAAAFDGEFSNVTRSYAGKGVVRYAW